MRASPNLQRLKSPTAFRSPDNSAATAQNKPISKTVIAGIVAASILGFVSILAIVIFLVSQCRQRRAMNKQLTQSPNADSPVLPIQNPDLEAGPDIFEEKQFDDNVKRSNSRFTVKSFASRWSQASFASPALPEPSEVPPVPRLPGLPTAPKLSLTVPSKEHKRSVSSLSGSTGSTTLHSPGDGDSVLDDYYYRHSTASINSVSSNMTAIEPELLTTDPVVTHPGCSTASRPSTWS